MDSEGTFTCNIPTRFYSGKEIFALEKFQVLTSIQCNFMMRLANMRSQGRHCGSAAKLLSELRAERSSSPENSSAIGGVSTPCKPFAIIDFLHSAGKSMIHLQVRVSRISTKKNVAFLGGIANNWVRLTYCNLSVRDLINMFFLKKIDIELNSKYLGYLKKLTFR